MDNQNGFIKVHSLKLLKALEQNRCMGLLHRIKLGNEVIDGVRYPEYEFYSKPDVMDIKQKFEDQYGKDSAKLDDPKEWIGYKESYVSNSWDKSIKKIITINYYCLSRLFNEGFASQLISVGKNTRGKRMFVFSYDATIEQIVLEEKEKSKKVFMEKHKDDDAVGQG